MNSESIFRRSKNRPGLVPLTIRIGQKVGRKADESIVEWDIDAYVYYWILVDDIRWYMFNPDGLTKWDEYMELKSIYSRYCVWLTDMKGNIIFEGIISK